MRLTTDQANAVYSTLVKHAGAYDGDRWAREEFIYHLTETDCREYRFGGKLGFGGKFWNLDNWYVNYYKENKTPERDETEKNTNEALTELRTFFP